MKIELPRRRLIWLTVASLLFLVTVALLLLANKRRTVQNNWVAHTNEVMAEVSELQLMMADPGNYFRQGIIEGNGGKYKPQIDSIAERNLYQLASVEELVRDNPQQTRIIQDVAPAVKTLSAYYRDSAGTAAVARSLEAEENIVRRLHAMKINEQVLLASRLARYERLTAFVKYLAYFITGIVLTILLLSSVGLYRETKLVRQSRHEAEQHRRSQAETIGQLNAANEQLKELRSYEKFTSTGRVARVIAHEVRNPLTNINLAADELAETASEDDKAMLDIISRNSRKINELISSLLNATKFTELKVEPVSLNKLLDETLATAQDSIAMKHIVVEKDYDKTDCIIAADPEKMKIAFLNLVVNAVEAMDKGGRLQVSTSDGENSCRITIADNGKGMSEETTGKIFEPFYTGKEKGTGLGLTNTQNIILNHGGSIGVKSKENKGTTFTVQLAKSAAVPA